MVYHHTDLASDSPQDDRMMDAVKCPLSSGFLGVNKVNYVTFNDIDTIPSKSSEIIENL